MQIHRNRGKRGGIKEIIKKHLARRSASTGLFLLQTWPVVVLPERKATMQLPLNLGGTPQYYYTVHPQHNNIMLGMARAAWPRPDGHFVR